MMDIPEPNRLSWLLAIERLLVVALAEESMRRDDRQAYCEKLRTAALESLPTGRDITADAVRDELERMLGMIEQA